MRQTLLTSRDHDTSLHWSLADVYTVEGLNRLDQYFWAWLKQKDQSLVTERDSLDLSDRGHHSKWLMSTAPYLESFVLSLLPEKAHKSYQLMVQRYAEELDVVKFHKWAEKIERRQAEVDKDIWQELNGSYKQIFIEQYDPLKSLTNRWIEKPDEVSLWLSGYYRYESEKTHSELKFLATKVDHEHLFDWQGVGRLSALEHEKRSGFDLTDPPITTRFVQQHVHYCLHCHVRAGDFCAVGFPVKKQDPEQGFRSNALGDTLTGCPLEEHVSEMMVLRSQGYILAALATIMVENPLCVLTGQKICNDCMKSCVYQKQDPVDVPKVETQTLKDILSLPFGAEIVMLLMSWNPLRLSQSLPVQQVNKSIAVMGFGPSGIAMAYHLLMSGLKVVMMDGMRLKELPSDQLDQVIEYFDDMSVPLSQRQPRGFGGVAEYGITVRWDKNLLLMPQIYLSRWGVKMVGEVRFGGTVTVDDIWRMGFRHLVLALGAGLPKALNIPGSLAPGMMSANDFLMNLQLNGAALSNTWSMMPIRTPIVVIGAGLTAVDAATEARAYYFTWIERFARMWRTAYEAQGDALWAQFSQGECAIMREWLMHAKMAQTTSAAQCMKEWGEVAIVYRKNIQSSPAYRGNHLELEDAMKQGVLFEEHISPKRIVCDAHGWISQLVCERDGKEVVMDAKTVIVATGQQPNVAYGYEHFKAFKRQGDYYELQNKQREVVDQSAHVKQAGVGFHLSSDSQHRISVVGDLHPVFQGSVVKAIASAKRAYGDVLKSVAQMSPMDALPIDGSHLVKCERYGNEFLITVYAPLSVVNAKLGHLWRIQPYPEDIVKTLGEHTHVESVVASFVAKDVDKQHVVVSVFADSPCMQVIEQLSHGDALSFMGPTGVRMRLPDVPEQHAVFTDRSGLLRSLSFVRGWQEIGCKVVLVLQLQSDEYFPEAYFSLVDRRQLLLVTIGAQNMASDFHLDFRHAIDLEQYKKQGWLADTERVVIQGDVAWLKSWSVLRQVHWQQAMPKCQKITGAVLGSMQCMLKGICARCMQWQVDPETGQRTKAVFACSWQDQPIEMIDMHHLSQRDDMQKFVEKCQRVLSKQEKVQAH